MATKYEIGQKIIIAAPAKGNLSSLRDSALEAYSGKSGKITDYHWIRTGMGTVFYIYTIRMDTDNKDIVLHEDEIQAHME